MHFRTSLCDLFDIDVLRGRSPADDPLARRRLARLRAEVEILRPTCPGITAGAGLR